MSSDPYSARVRELFDAPVHAGCPDSPLSSAIEDQGVRIRLSAASTGGKIATLGFQAWGCPHVIAAAEQACASLEGQPISALLEFSAADLMESLTVPTEKTGRILVLEDAVRSLGSIVRDASNPDD